MNIEWHFGKPWAEMKFEPSESHKKAMAEAIGAVLSDEPTDTTLASIMAADQADAATDALASRIARFYETVKASGMSDETAGELVQSFAVMATSQHFGVDVAQMYGVGPIYGMED